jgi:hypothetical protein
MKRTDKAKSELLRVAEGSGEMGARCMHVELR